MLLETNFNWNSPIGLSSYKLTKMALYDKLERAFKEATSNSLPKKEKNTNKLLVFTQSLGLIEQRQATRKKYQNHRNPENYDIWRNIAELADISLVNDKINKTEQMCVETDAASNGNDAKELFIIVKQLNGESLNRWPSSVNKRNGEPLSSFSDLLDEWAEYFNSFITEAVII